MAYLSVNSTATAESAARGSTIGDIGFGDNVVGGIKFNPVVIAIVVVGLLVGVWLWKGKK